MSLTNPSTPPSVKIRASSLLLVRSAEEAALPLNSKKPPPALAIEANNEFTATSISLKDLLSDNLSPSPLSKPRKTKPPFVAEEGLDPAAAMIAARRKIRASSSMGCASPKNTGSRPRRRLEKEEACGPDVGDARKPPKKRRQAAKPKAAGRKESTIFNLPSVPSCPCPPSDQGLRDQAVHMEENKLDCLAISDLLMWKNSAKSALWFGMGSIFFLSSPFSADFRSFSIVSAVSHMGILALAVAFFCDSFSKRLPQLQSEGECGFRQLTEDDLFRAARAVLPLANSAIAKIRIVFSGEPSTTLKAVPLLLLGARYGHLITLWRLSATGFFLGFTIPKLCSLYSQQIRVGVESTGRYAEEAWSSCSHKKLVVSSAAFAFWNLTGVKERIFAAFFCVVVLRYRNLRRISMAASVVTESCSGDGESSTTTTQQAQTVVEEEEEEEEEEAD